ncbi:unnamed protein product [Sphacelaria rigidula]
MIGTRCVYKVKADGLSTARLVVQGWAQHDFDCGSTFAPVCRLESQRILLAIATAKKWPVIALDVRTAFLNGKLKETVFCKQPPGFETTDPATGQPHVMRLSRALYGPRQSPNVWNFTIDSESRKMGFTATASDSCVYTRELNDKYVMLTLFVNDILLTGPSIKLLQDVQDTLKNIFSFGSGTRFPHPGYGNHERYRALSVETFNMESSNSVHTPGITNSILPDSEEHLLDQQGIKQYQAMVVSLTSPSASPRSPAT